MLPFHNAFWDRIGVVMREYETPTAFARVIGVDQNTVYNWCLRRNFPRLDCFAEVVRRCGVSADWLLGLSDDPGREIREVKQKPWHGRGWAYQKEGLL